MGGKQGKNGGKGKKGEKGAAKFSAEGVVAVILKQGVAIDMLNALVLALGVAPTGKKGKKKGKGKTKPKLGPRT